MPSKLKVLYQGIKRRYHHLKYYKHLKLGIRQKSRWYGNSYGGFYAIPTLLNEQSVVYSFGIGEDISFDEAIIESHGCPVFAFDPTPKSIHWCSQQSLPKNFHFYPYGLAIETSTRTFYLPKNTQYVSGSLMLHEHVSEAQAIQVEMKSFGDIAQSLGHKAIDLVKMDIEGAEYAVLNRILKASLPIHQLAIEFHGRFFEDGRARDIQALQQLERHGYALFAISNTFQELSFVRKASLLGD